MISIIQYSEKLFPNMEWIQGYEINILRTIYGAIVSPELVDVVVVSGASTVQASRARFLTQWVAQRIRNLPGCAVYSSTITVSCIHSCKTIHAVNLNWVITSPNGGRKKVMLSLVCVNTCPSGSVVPGRTSQERPIVGRRSQCLLCSGPESGPSYPHLLPSSDGTRGTGTVSRLMLSLLCGNLSLIWTQWKFSCSIFLSRF